MPCGTNILSLPRPHVFEDLDGAKAGGVWTNLLLASVVPQMRLESAFVRIFVVLRDRSTDGKTVPQGAVRMEVIGRRWERTPRCR